MLLCFPYAEQTLIRKTELKRRQWRWIHSRKTNSWEFAVTSWGCVKGLLLLSLPGFLISNLDGNGWIRLAWQIILPSNVHYDFKYYSCLISRVMPCGFFKAGRKCWKNNFGVSSAKTTIWLQGTPYSGTIRIAFGCLAFDYVHPHHSAQAFLLLTPTEVQP